MTQQNRQSIIFHMCRIDEWDHAVGRGRYAGSTQDAADGFIHFSTAEQIVESAAKHRAGQDGLVIVAADTARCGPWLEWEASRGGALFPHLYSDLAMDAVVGAHLLPLGSDGNHQFPALDNPSGWPAYQPIRKTG